MLEVKHQPKIKQNSKYDYILRQKLNDNLTHFIFFTYIYIYINTICVYFFKIKKTSHYYLIGLRNCLNKK